MVGLLLALVMAAVVWWTQGDGSTPGSQADPGTSSQAPSPTGTPSPSPSDSPSRDSTETNAPVTEPSQRPGTDPMSGLPFVLLAQLPPEAAETVELIDAGGPFPEDEDGGTFENREDLLPDEQTGLLRRVHRPDPGLGRPRCTAHRGRRRAASSTGPTTTTASFERIAR